MLKAIVFASPVEGYRLQIRYEDGVGGIVDLGEMLRFGEYLRR